MKEGMAFRSEMKRKGDRREERKGRSRPRGNEECGVRSRRHRKTRKVTKA